MIILKVTRNQGFTISLENKFFEKPQGGGQFEPPGILRLTTKRYKLKIIRALQLYLCDN